MSANGEIQVDSDSVEELRLTVDLPVVMMDDRSLGVADLATLTLEAARPEVEAAVRRRRAGAK